MVMLATLDQTKLALRWDHDIEDDDLELKIATASELVLDYLKLSYDHFDDSSGEPIDVPASYINAVITLVGMLKEGASPERWPAGYLPSPVSAQLYMNRLLTIA